MIRRLLLATFLTSTASLSPALAADEVEEKPEGEIVVTGQKAERSLLDTQASVGVITSERIRDQDLTSLREAFRTLGNVIDSDFVDAGFVIRGVNSEGLTPGGSPLAAIYVDGAEQTTQGARRGARGLWDVEQVEVYRGPQSTLSGRAALAGAIHIRTRQPQYDYEVAARASYGELDSFDAAIAGGGAVIDDVIAFRVAGEYQRRDSEVNYPTFSSFNRFDRLNKDEYYQLRGRVRIDPAPGLQINLTYAYAKDAPAYDDIAGPGFGFDYSERRGDFNLPLFQEARLADNHSRVAELTYDLSPTLKLTALSTLVDTNLDRSSVNAGTPGETFVTTGAVDERLFTQEMRLNFGSTGNLEGVVGLYYANDRSDSGFVRTAPFGGGRTDTSQTISRNRNYALFGEVTVPLSDAVRLTGGGRIDHNRRRTAVSSARDNFNPAFADRSSSDALGASETVFLPKGAIDFSLTDAMRLGFTVQRGYRPGGASRNSASGAVTPFDAEFTTNYEGSLRHQFGSRGNVAVNVFYTDWKSQQVEFDLVPGDFTSRVTVNAGRSRLFGGEIEASYRLATDVNAFASVGVVDTKFRDFVVADLGDFSGLEFPESPSVSASAGVDYRPERGLFAGADVRYVSSYFARDLQNLPLDKVGNYVVANARIGYDFGPGSIMLFADNLFNERYFVYRDRIEVGDPAGPFDCCGTLGRSRIVGVTGEIRF